MHLCSDSAVKMYQLCTCPCSGVFGATLSKYVLLKYRFFYVKSLVFHTSINFQLYDFDTCQCIPFCHSRKKFIFDSNLRVLNNKKLLWVKLNLWSSQDKTIEIYSHCKCLFIWKIFIQSSIVHKL